MPTTTWSERRGATLPLSILVIAVLSLSMLVAASRLSSERQITSDHEAVMDAFAVAQAGMEEYFRALTALPPGTLPPISHDTTITTLPGGTAQVSFRRLRDSTSTTPAVYVVTSRGTNTAATRFSFRVGSAQRTVAQYAYWQPAISI
jgi:type II secretory pathway pseudopilin PulG